MRSERPSHGELRIAADYLDDARTHLMYGKLDVEVDNDDLVERMDEVIGELDATLKQLATMEEAIEDE